MHQKSAIGVIHQFRLDGKVSLVSGASRGIGLAMAEGLAGAGSELVIAGRDMTTLKPVPSELLPKPAIPCCLSKRMSATSRKLTHSSHNRGNLRPPRRACEQCRGQCSEPGTGIHRNRLGFRHRC